MYKGLIPVLTLHRIYNLVYLDWLRCVQTHVL